MILLDSNGEIVANVREDQYPLKMPIATMWGNRVYRLKINYYRDPNTKELDKTRIKSVNLEIER